MGANVQAFYHLNQKTLDFSILCTPYVFLIILPLFIFAHQVPLNFFAPLKKLYILCKNALPLAPVLITELHYTPSLSGFKEESCKDYLFGYNFSEYVHIYIILKCLSQKTTNRLSNEVHLEGKLEFKVIAERSAMLLLLCYKKENKYQYKSSCPKALIIDELKTLVQTSLSEHIFYSIVLHKRAYTIYVFACNLLCSLKSI